MTLLPRVLGPTVRVGIVSQFYDKSTQVTTMSYEEFQSVAQISCALLFIWELIKTNWAGALLSGIIMFLVFQSSPSPATCFIAGGLTVPILLEERWNTRAKKDLVRGVLATLVFTANFVLIIGPILDRYANTIAL